MSSCPLQAFCHRICWCCTFILKRITALHGDSGLCVSSFSGSSVWVKVSRLGCEAIFPEISKFCDRSVKLALTGFFKKAA